MLKLDKVYNLAGKVGRALKKDSPTPVHLAEPALTGDEIELTGVDERLGTVRFKVDQIPHIKVDNSICQDCSTTACVYACPANLFTLLSDGTILFNYEQCFECGTCYVACNREGAITWTYPRGGFGVSFREA